MRQNGLPSRTNPWPIAMNTWVASTRLKPHCRPASTNLKLRTQKLPRAQRSFPTFCCSTMDRAFLKGNGAERERAAARGHENPQAEWMFDHEAFVLAYSGHLRRAMMTSQRAVDLAEQSARPEEAAMFESVAALWDGWFGKAYSARSALAALKLSKNRDAEYGAAFALALSGDSQRSLILANDLESRFPEDTSVKFSYLPALPRALCIALSRSRKSDSSPAGCRPL